MNAVCRSTRAGTPTINQPIDLYGAASPAPVGQATGLGYYRAEPVAILGTGSVDAMPMGPRQEHFQLCARYNRWANVQLYGVAGECTDEALRQDRGAFFRSIIGTLNHVLVADRIWTRRIEGRSSLGMKLDDVLFDDLTALASARREEDQRIVDLMVDATEDRLAQVLAYTTTAGVAQEQPLHQVLAHVFNHQTHHRGQVHDLLGQALTPSRTPVLDLLHYLRTAHSIECS